VPTADATLAPIPPDLSDEQALLLGDIFSTAYFAADNAGIGHLAAEAAQALASESITGGRSAPGGLRGPIVAVVGCGPVSLLAILCELCRYFWCSVLPAVKGMPPDMPVVACGWQAPGSLEPQAYMRLTRCRNALH
jgi:threonine dehydrogenase-like Zn-dependent dehydrogenase